MTQVRKCRRDLYGEYSSESVCDYFATKSRSSDKRNGKVFLTAWRRDAAERIGHYLLLKEEGIETPVSRDIIQFAESEYLTAHEAIPSVFVGR